jgi:hypothetical protein
MLNNQPPRKMTNPKCFDMKSRVINLKNRGGTVTQHGWHAGIEGCGPVLTPLPFQVICLVTLPRTMHALRRVHRKLATEVTGRPSSHPTVGVAVLLSGPWRRPPVHP